jgi:asparagine synthase (glutamine-hydrolysing)
MCGIVGWIDWEADLTLQGAVIERMAQTLSHRGPDTRGCWLSPRAALAHRRLIVIDPEGGTQPMIYQVGERTYALTYNGELYNFRELRRELVGRGHTFRTFSDTEVLLHAYVEWGEKCVNLFNGIFAFGLWDEQKQQLLLARDHLGVKPLFYAQRGNAILFGSELKALLAHPSIKAEIDTAGLADLFSFRRAPGSAVFRDVHELRGGHFLTVTRLQMRIRRYWNLHSKPHTEDLPTTVEHIRALLEDTVRRQLIADVPVVTMLSGGLDSSGLTALASQEFKREGKTLHTYSLDFVDNTPHFQRSLVPTSSQDDYWAQRVSKHLRSQHHVIKVDTSELIENLLVPMRAHDLPAMGQMETSLYLLFQAMKRDATVTLSGESGDEVFGGYPWFHEKALVNAPAFPWTVVMGPWLGLIGGYPTGRELFSWLSAEAIQQVKPAEYIERLYQGALAEVPHLEGEDLQTASMRNIHYMTIFHFLPILLDRKDRISMAVGFEARVPYCDYRLIEYVWNIPWEMKNIGQIEKGILRQAFTDLLPYDACHRRKSGYPSAQSPAYLEAIRQWTLQILSDPYAPIRPFIDVNAIRRSAEGQGSLSDEVALYLYERVIQTNTWFQDYQVSVCS